MMSAYDFESSCACCGLSTLDAENPEFDEMCQFRLHKCPGTRPSCQWVGTIDTVMRHLKHHHKDSVMIEQGEDIVFRARNIIRSRTKKWVKVQMCHQNHFLVVLEKQQMSRGKQQFFMVVRFLGTRKQAEQFACRLELKNGERSLCWEGTPRSFNEGMTAAIMRCECLVFSAHTALCFVNNGYLSITVKISKVLADLSDTVVKIEREKCIRCGHRHDIAY